MARVVIADDDAGIRFVLRTALLQNGHTVREAGDGNTAIALLEAEPADLLVTDLVMPGKEGIETIVELRRMQPNLRIIAISGGMRGGRFDFLPIAERLGAKRTLSKPFSIHDFLQAVESVLAS
jgi:CheY-like chemotaxis protein